MRWRWETLGIALGFALGALLIVGGLLGSMLSLALGVDLWVTLLAVSCRAHFRGVPPFDRRVVGRVGGLAALWLIFVCAEAGLLLPREAAVGAVSTPVVATSGDLAPPPRHTLTPGELAGAPTH